MKDFSTTRDGSRTHPLVNRRRFLALAGNAGLTVGAAAALAGCSQSEDASDGSDESGGGDIKLSTVTTPAALERLGVIFKWYADANPSYSIDVEPFAGTPDEWIQHLTTRNLAGNTPDLWDMDVTTADYVGRGLPLALDDLMSQQEIDLSIFPESLREAFSHDGKLYGIPSSTSFQVLAYNADLFDEAGVPYPPDNWDDPSWTLEEYIDRAKALTEIDDRGRMTQIGSMGLGGLYLALPLFGADWLTPDGESNMQSPEFIQALTDIDRMMTADQIQPPPSQLEALTAVGDVFLGGKAAMTMAAGPRIPLYLEAEFNWNIAPLPAIADEAYGWLLPQAHAIFDQSKNPDAAWHFTRWVSTAEREAEWATAYGRLPVTADGAQAWADSMQESKPDMQVNVVTDLLEDRGRPNTDTEIVQSAQFREILAEVIVPIQQVLGNGERTPEELARTGDEKLQKILSS